VAAAPAPPPRAEGVTRRPLRRRLHTDATVHNTVNATASHVDTAGSSTQHATSVSIASMIIAATTVAVAVTVTAIEHRPDVADRCVAA